MSDWSKPVDWPAVQRRLGVSADGVPGPATLAALMRNMGSGTLADDLGAALVPHLLKSTVCQNRRRLAHWLGQNAHESGGFSRLVESLTYSSAARIRAVWPSRFATDADAEPFVRNPQALAERVYGGRMGNTQPGDGFRFRGRGLKMITGRNNYTAMRDVTGIDIVGNPDLAADPETAVRLSLLFWTRTGCDKWADADDIGRLSNLINRGSAVATPAAIGFADRVNRTQSAKALVL